MPISTAKRGSDEWVKGEGIVDKDLYLNGQELPLGYKSNFSTFFARSFAYRAVANGLFSKVIKEFFHAIEEIR